MAAGDVNLSAQLSGETEIGGAIGPLTLAYILTHQKYAWEAKDFRVAQGTAIGAGVPLAVPAIPAGMVQTLFVIKTDLPIDFQLNGAVPTYSLKTGGLYVMAPGFDVTAIELANGGTVEAKVYVLQVVATA
jgi:hypothetical protein